MGWEFISDSEMPKVIAATKSGRCVSCYEDIECTGHFLYCHNCDDGCDLENE